MPSLCVRALWMEILWKQDSLTVEWILMLIQKQQPVISAGIGRSGGVSRSEVQFIPTSEPHQLESGLQKNGGLPGKRWDGPWAWVPTIVPAHQRILTILSQTMDHSKKTKNSSLNFGCSCLFYYFHPSERACEEKALFWICLLASIALAGCGF